MSSSFREKRGGRDVVPARECRPIGVGAARRTGIAARPLIVAAWAGIAIGRATQGVGSDRLTPPDAPADVAATAAAATSGQELPALKIGPDDWMERWGVDRKRHWGLANLDIIDDPSDTFRKVFRVSYPRGQPARRSLATRTAPVGGSQFYARLGLPPRTSLHLRYYVRFDADFDFVKGGKLPGLVPGGSVHSGQHIPDAANGFSTRFMCAGTATARFTPTCRPASSTGLPSAGATGRFRPGRWTALEQEVVLNTPGAPTDASGSGLHGEPVLNEDHLTFRDTDKLRIEGIFFSTFFGGDDASWATPKATHIDFVQFSVSDRYIGK